MSSNNDVYIKMTDNNEVKTKQFCCISQWVIIVLIFIISFCVSVGILISCKYIYEYVTNNN